VLRSTFHAQKITPWHEAMKPVRAMVAPGVKEQEAGGASFKRSDKCHRSRAPLKARGCQKVGYSRHAPFFYQVCFAVFLLFLQKSRGNKHLKTLSQLLAGASMSKRDKNYMPQSTAGLIRYFDDSKSGYKLKPEHVLIACTALAGIEIAIRLMA